MSKYVEVHNLFYDENNNSWCIDAWESYTDNEPGKVVAYVNATTGDVVYTDCADAKEENVIDSVVEVLNDIRNEQENSILLPPSLTITMKLLMKNEFEAVLNGKCVEDAICRKVNMETIWHLYTNATREEIVQCCKDWVDASTFLEQDILLNESISVRIHTFNRTEGVEQMPWYKSRDSKFLIAAMRRELKDDFFGYHLDQGILKPMKK